MRPAVLHAGYRLTIPVREALEHAGNIVRPAVAQYPGDRAGIPYWDIELSCPIPVVVCRIINTSDIALRLAIEPRYPGEILAAWWERGEWLPCPRCGAATLWDEAGRVPGARCCVKGHRVQVNSRGTRITREGA